jgi:signal transduction histidine kinase
MPALFESAKGRLILAVVGACFMALSGVCSRAADSENVLTNAGQIRNLTFEEASRRLPVLLRGVVVTEAGPFGNLAVVLADETAGIYMLGQTNAFLDVHRGDLLEVKGVTDPGEFAPIVRVKEFHRAGRGQIPTPRVVTFEQLIAGSLDGQLVQVSGVVRSWAPVTDPNEFGVWHMELAAGGGRLTVSANDSHPPGVEQDAEVRVEGVCFYQFNNKRQVLSPVVLISREVALEIEKPAPADPFASPVRAVSTLRQFSPSTDYKHRVHVHGIVTHQQPGWVWLRDESRGLRVQTQPELLKAGDSIDVVGYLRFGAEAPVLEDAVFRRQHSGSPPAPIKLVAVDDAFNHEEDLVSIDGLLMQVQPILGGWAFTIQDKATSFKAVLRRADNERSADVLPGSRVRVTGICSVVSDDSRTVTTGIRNPPSSFQILLRSPEDLAVLAPPPWWTPAHIILLFAGLASASLLVTALVMLSARRHAKEQKIHRTMAEAEFAAILAERNRLAREIHDTLAQGLAATSVQLRLAKKYANGASEVLSHHLSTAQDLVRESLAEARNSIWNMRSHVLESSDLAGALKEVLKQRCDGTGIETSVEVSGRSRRFAPFVENNLLRIGQEAIFNATKYSQAKKIAVKLEFGEKDFRLVVHDDGHGFDTTKPEPVAGGLGLIAMRERAGELKGDLKINSDSKNGTVIIFSVPLSGD